ncbi:MAG: hypothetical protein KAS86_05450, partial [Candidatus Omnitrophica bacterium]|nr:hypothetical protein [Candidatus Omnitrophota bacterium]
YFDDISQAGEFKERLEQMISKASLEDTAGGRIKVNVFDEEGAKEIEIVEQAGKPNTITLADSKLGRATNVRLAEKIGFVIDKSGKALAALLKRRGMSEKEIEVEVDKLIDHLAGENGLFFISDVAARSRKKDEIEVFLRSQGAGPGSAVWDIVRQKYFDGLFLIDLSPDGSLQAMVQKFGRNRRAGDMGSVDSYYSLHRGSRFYRMVEELYSPSHNPRFTRREKKKNRKKLIEFHENAERLEKLEKSIFDNKGHYLEEIDGDIFSEWCGLQQYFSSLLKEVRIEQQKRADDKKDKRNKTDMKKQKFLDMVRGLPGKFKKAVDQNPEKAGLFIEDRLGAIMDRYFTLDRVDDNGVLDLEEFLGVFGEHFHVDLGKTAGFAQVRLAGKNARELVHIRGIYRDGLLNVLLSMGSARARRTGAEVTVNSGDVSYSLVLNRVTGHLELTGVKQILPDGTRQEVMKPTEPGSFMIGDNEYMMKDTGGGVYTLIDRQGNVTQRFSVAEYRDRKTQKADGYLITLEGVLGSAAVKMYGEGLDRLKTKLIKEFDKTGGEIVETDISDAGLTEAAIDISRERYLDKARKAEVYDSPEAQPDITEAASRMDRALKRLPGNLAEQDRSAEEVMMERLGKDEDFAAVRDASSIRRATKEADEKVASDVRQDVGTFAAQQVRVDTSADTSNITYSVSGTDDLTRALAGITGVDTRDLAAENLDREDKRDAEKEAESGSKEKGVKERMDREAGMERERIGKDYVAVSVRLKQTKASLSAGENVQAFAVPPSPDEPPEPEVVMVAPYQAVQNLTDGEKEDLAAELFHRYGRSVPRGGTLYVSFDGFSKGETDAETGAICRAFSGVRIFDGISANALVEQKNEIQKAGKALTQEDMDAIFNLTPEHGEKVFTRKVGSLNLLVWAAADGTTHVRSLGTRVYNHTRRSIQRADAVLAGKDNECKKAGLRAEDLTIDEKGIFVKAAGRDGARPLVDFALIAADNNAAGEKIERLPLTKETGLPVRRGLRALLARRIRGVWEEIKGSFVWSGRKAITLKEWVDYRAGLARRKGISASSVLWGALWVVNKAALGFPAYLIRDARRDFAAWSEKKKKSYERARHRARQLWNRKAWYQSWRHRFDSVSSDRKVLKNLARTGSGALDLFTVRAGFSLSTLRSSVLVSLSGLMGFIAAAVYVLLIKVPKEIAKFTWKLVFYHSWHYPYSKMAAWWREKWPEQEPQPALADVIEARLPETVRNGKITGREALIEAQRLADIKLPAGEASAAMQKISAYESGGTEDPFFPYDESAVGRLSQIAILLLYARKDPHNTDQRFRGAYTRIGDCLFRMAEDAEKTGTERSKTRAKELRVNAFNYLSIASAVDEKDMTAEALRGVILYSLGDKDKAKKALEKAVKKGVPDERVMSMACAVLGKTLEHEAEDKKADQKGAVKLYRRAAGAYQKAGRFEVAVPGEKISIMEAKARCREKAGAEPPEKEKKAGEEKASWRQRITGLFAGKGKTKGDILKRQLTMTAVGAGILVAAAFFFPAGLAAVSGALSAVKLPVLGKMFGFIASQLTVLEGVSVTSLLSWDVARVLLVLSPMAGNLFLSLGYKPVKGLLRRVYDISTDPFRTGRMVDAERSAMRQTPAKAGPRIRLIKAYDSLDKDKKVSGLID